MSIQNELSSDIAVALLTDQTKRPEELKELKELIFRIHELLQDSKTDVSSQRAHAHAVGRKQND